MGLDIGTGDETQIETSSTEATTSSTTNGTETQTQEVTQENVETTSTETTESTTETETEESGAEDKGNENLSEDFDYSKYQEEFFATGDISEKSRGELYKTFPKNLVDNYIENMKQATAYAVAETERKAFDVVGGEENYKSLIGWASANLDKEEKETFNEIVNGGNEKLAIQAIKGLKARMDIATVSRKPQVVLGSSDSSSAKLDVFLSRQDYANAIAKAEYQTSPQYRAEIDEKLARTLKNGGYKA